jgi:hypothetical protein
MNSTKQSTVYLYEGRKMVPQWWFGNPHRRPSVGRRSQRRSTVSSCNQSAIEGRLEEEDNDNKEEDDDSSAQEESPVDSELAYQVRSVTYKNIA